MRLEKLRKMDLNLLVIFMVLAEERHVSRAAVRLSLSQPAVSRALQRLRYMLGDDLMIRAGGSYALTPAGQRLFDALGSMLPRLEKLMGGTRFDPNSDHARFRIVLTDNAAAVLVPLLCREILPGAEKVVFHFLPWHEQAYDDLLHGRVDLLLNADDGHAPPFCRTETLYEDQFVCVVAAEASYTNPLSMEAYLEASHICVDVLGGVQTIPQRQLTQSGVARHCSLHVPYFITAIRSVAGTNLVATVPRKLAVRECSDARIRILEPPKELSAFNYLMIWHPRVEPDSAHAWLRSVMRQAGQLVMRA